MEQKTYTEENLRTCTRGSERELEQKLQGGKLHGTRDSALFAVIAAWSMFSCNDALRNYHTARGSVTLPIRASEPVSLRNLNTGMSSPIKLSDSLGCVLRVCSSSRSRNHFTAFG